EWSPLPGAGARLYRAEAGIGGKLAARLRPSGLGALERRRAAEVGLEIHRAGPQPLLRRVGLPDDVLFRGLRRLAWGSAVASGQPAFRTRSDCFLVMAYGLPALQLVVCGILRASLVPPAPGRGANDRTACVAEGPPATASAGRSRSCCCGTAGAQRRSRTRG